MSNPLIGLRSRAELRVVAQIQVQNSKNSATVIDNALDQGLRSALTRMVWPQLIRDFPTAIAVAEGDIYFHAPKECRQVLVAVDSTSPFVLRSTDAHTLAQRVRGFMTLSGRPGEFSWVGTVGIKVSLLSTGEALEILSDGTDTRTGIIEGFNVAGDRVKTSFTLTGTTQVAVGTFVDVTRLQIDTQDEARTVTLRRVTGATTAGTIGPEELTAEYQRYRMNAKAPQALVLHLIYYYTPPAVINDDDRYPIPIEDFLIHFAISRYYLHQHQLTLAEAEFALAESRLRDAMFEAEASTPHFAVPSNPRRRPLGVIVEGLN